MNLVVCVKQILDPEMPPQDFSIDQKAKVAIQGKASLVMSTFDEIGVEVALKLREKINDIKIVALTVGPESAEDVLRKSLAMLVDEAMHIQTDDQSKLDSFTTAVLLASAIRTLDEIDLVICGRQAGDTDAGQVGLLLAEELGLPTVTAVTEIEPQKNRLRLRRDSDRGVEIVECSGPVCITVTNSVTNVPRVAKVKNIIASHRKNIKRFSAEELLSSKTLQDLARVEIDNLFIPKREIECEIIPGEEADELAEGLLNKLLELKAL